MSLGGQDVQGDGYWRSRLASSVDVSLLSPKNQGKPLGKYCPKRGFAEKTSHAPPCTQAHVPRPGPRVLPCGGLTNYSAQGMWAGRAELLGDQRCFCTSTLVEIIWKCTLFHLRKYNLGPHLGFLWGSRAFGSPGIRLSSREHCSAQQEIADMAVGTGFQDP